MTQGGDFAVGRLQDHPAARRHRRIIGFDSKDTALKMTADLPGLNRGGDAYGIGMFGLLEVGAAIDDDDAVVLGESDGIFDGGIAAAAYHYGLAVMILSAFQRGLHAWVVFSRHLQPAGISLNTQGQNDVFRMNGIAVFERDLKRPPAARDAHGCGAVAHIDVAASNTFLPLLQNSFPSPGGEGDVAAQGQHAGFRHHMLTTLILLNGVRVLVRGLEQNVGHSALRRAGGRAQSSGTRTQDCKVEMILRCIAHSWD
jgi:hypothetical protein